MTQTLTTEAMQEIYEAAVHSEASGSQEAEFELLCKLEDVGGTNATIRKLIDMVRAANREAQPVAIVESSAYVTAAQIIGDEPPMKAVKELYEGALVIGQQLYTAPPAPVVNPEFTGATAVPGYISTRQAIANMERHELCGSINVAYKHGWNDFRAATLAQPVSQRYKLPDGFKLMPTEITDEIAEAIAMEARCCGGIALCIYEAALAAAPEGGNG